MIDFQLTPADENVLSTAHEQALIGQRYARYYDKHEDELEPEEFPEAKGLPNPITLAEEGLNGSSGARILHSLVMLEIYWAESHCIAASGDLATLSSRQSRRPSNSRSGRTTQ